MWPQGWSWTKEHLAIVKNPDRILEKIWVHSGPFYYRKWKLPFKIGKRQYLEFYWLFRPTPPWSKGGNEGVFPFIKRILQKLNMSNLALLPTIRLKRG
ncbi:MAG: hypothetical protein ACOYWZ_20145 [Bacillota bacterium]